jgi:hypothetical protein
MSLTPGIYEALLNDGLKGVLERVTRTIKPGVGPKKEAGER